VLNECGQREAAGGGLRDAFARTGAGKALFFSAAGPVSGRRWRPPGMQTRDLRAQNAQEHNRGVDAAGNLVNVG
jgi:hypothetical protein